jgi:hypothetical protein
MAGKVVRGHVTSFRSGLLPYSTQSGRHNLQAGTA